MKWFYNLLKKKYEHNLVSDKQERISVGGRIPRIEGNGMTFTVYRANGGHVIETRTYNRKTDESDHSLHIITEDKDLGAELGQIITFEALRR